MSMVYCNQCDRYIDSDYVECHEDPSNPLELVCDDCYVARLDEEEDNAS